MNIKEAKTQIENAMKAYFTKDKFGNYKIPIEHQRPIFLMGPPGIGKTAIMEQIAADLGVGLVSYSMTHHTRQSALGLPFIEKKIYGGKEYTVSEYTMSEIIASVYDMMEQTDLKEGILFLDEINCVSETLAPSMLQFLQYKIFGRHRVPDGWIVVTAGNPPEYNNSVREFDIVTWDRLKRIDVQPDFEVWKEYAYRKGIHAAIISYLDIRKSDFYKIESTVDGKIFVTARGWCDLSDMIQLYEQLNIAIDENLIGQYLQNPKIAKDFAIYYDLFNKYKSDYQIDKILLGNATEEIKNRAKQARFDERLSLLSLMLDGLNEDFHQAYLTEKSLTVVMDFIKNLRIDLIRPNINRMEIFDSHIKILENKIEKGKISAAYSDEQLQNFRRACAELENIRSSLQPHVSEDIKKFFELLKSEFEKRTKTLKTFAGQTGKKLSNAFKFCEEIFPDGQEILIFITELTLNYYSSYFISRYGCKEYFAHNKELLFYERQKEIIRNIESLELD
ncbi:MAG: AAA family ATPase [Clostridia bacterium]|nr:AAA family ATPase [Clostridia bacterium]